MKIGSPALLAILLAPASLLAREKTDIVVMENGDRWTGEIKKLSRESLSISLDYAKGTIAVDWSKVAYIESHQVFMVETEDSSVYMGSLRTAATAAGQPAAIQIALAEGQDVVIPKSDIVALDETAEQVWRRFSGGIDSGVIYAKGNDSLQYTIGLNTSYLRPRWAAQARLSSSLSLSEGTKSSSRNQVGLSSYRRLQWSSYFFAGLGSFLQSSEQQIQLQTSLGGGFGRYFENTERLRLALIVGAGWQATAYEPSVPEPTQNLGVGLVAAEVQISSFDKVTVTFNASFLPAFNDPGRLRFNTNASCYFKLFSNLSWNLSFYGNWDNRPPASLSGSDYGLSSGLGFTFGN